MPTSLTPALRFTIPGKPVPCPRPRVTKNGTHYPEEYTNWLEGARWTLRAAWAHTPGTIEYPVALWVWVYGVHMGSDGDNYLKAAGDALQWGWDSVLKNDNLNHVAEWHGFGFKEGKPRMDIEIRRPSDWLSGEIEEALR